MRLVSLEELLEKINALPRFNRSTSIMEIYNGGGDVAFLATDIQEMINNQLTIYKGKHGFQEDSTRKKTLMQFENVVIVK